MRYSAQQHAVRHFWHSKSSFCCCTIPSFILRKLPVQPNIFFHSKWFLYAAGAALSKPAGFSLHTEEVLKKCEHRHFICVGSQPRTGHSNLPLPVKWKCSKWEIVIFDWHVSLMRFLTEHYAWTAKEHLLKWNIDFVCVLCSSCFPKTACSTKQFMTPLCYSNCNQLGKQLLRGLTVKLKCISISLAPGIVQGITK